MANSPSTPTTPSPPVTDPTLGTLSGPILVGSQGYGCISCHVWDGRQLSQPDPGAVGPDLTRLVGRIRRDWFDRFLEDPIRSYPNTPMPAIFPHGNRASIATIVDGDPARQKEALWGYFSLGRDAPAPKPPPPFPVAAPAPGTSPLVAQIPIRLPDGAVVEALCLLTDHHDLLVYDLATGAPRALFTGGEILRNVQGRTRQFLASGSPAGFARTEVSSVSLITRGSAEVGSGRAVHGYDRLADGARVRSRATFKACDVEIEETLKIVRDATGGRFLREVRASGIPKDAALQVPLGLTGSRELGVSSAKGTARLAGKGQSAVLQLAPDSEGAAVASLELPDAAGAPGPALAGEAAREPRPGGRRGKA